MLFSAALLAGGALYLFLVEKPSGDGETPRKTARPEEKQIPAPVTVPPRSLPPPPPAEVSRPKLAPLNPEPRPAVAFPEVKEEETSEPAPKAVAPPPPVVRPKEKKAVKPAVSEEAYGLLIETLLTSNDENELLPVIDELKRLRDPRSLLKLQEAMERHNKGSRVRGSMSRAFTSIADGLRYPENLHILSSHAEVRRGKLFMEFEKKMPDWRERPETRSHFNAVRDVYLDRKSHVWAREGAAWFIGKAGYPESLDILAAGMDPREFWANRTAVVALREMHDERAIEPLLRATGFSDGVARLIATLALEELALPEKRYESYLDHDDPLVQGGAKLLLRKIRAAKGRRNP
jgi:hypothetical protein